MKRILSFAVLVVVSVFSWTASGAAEQAVSSGNRETATAKRVELFQSIEALLMLKKFTPGSLSKALGTPLHFDDTSADSTDTEAHGSAGSAIESVNIRGEDSRFLTMSMSSTLGVTMEDIRRHFGDAFGIHRPIYHHRTSKAPIPFYLTYSLPGQELSFEVSPEKPNILLEVILDRTAGILSETEPPQTFPAATKDDFLNRIEALAKLDNLNPASISKALGLSLDFKNVSDLAEYKEFMAIGKPDAAIVEVDLRGDPGRFLTVNIAPGLHITADDVRSHFGKEAKEHFQDDHLRDSPIYFMYPQPHQELEFGMKPYKTPVLVNFVINRTGSK